MRLKWVVKKENSKVERFGINVFVVEVIIIKKSPFAKKNIRYFIIFSVSFIPFDFFQQLNRQ